MGFNIYTEKISLRSTLETLLCLNLFRVIKLLRSFYTETLEQTSFHLASIWVGQVAVRWHHVQQNLDDIELSRSLLGHRRILMVQLSHSVGRLDRNIDFDLLRRNQWLNIHQRRKTKWNFYIRSSIGKNFVRLNFVQVVLLTERRWVGPKPSFCTNNRSFAHE